jgi:hypothetical protein
MTAGGKIPASILKKTCKHGDPPTSFQDKVMYLFRFSKGFLKLLLRIFYFYAKVSAGSRVIVVFPKSEDNSASTEMSLEILGNPVLLRFTYKRQGQGQYVLLRPADDDLSIFPPMLTLEIDEDSKYTYNERLPMDRPSSEKTEPWIDTVLGGEFHAGWPNKSINGTLQFSNSNSNASCRLAQQVYFRYV